MRALYVGDSLALGTGPHMRDAGVPVDLDAVVGRSTHGGVAALSTHVPLPGIVLVDLGTNDVSVPSFTTEVLRFLRLTPPDGSVFWMTSHRDGASGLRTALRNLAHDLARLHVVEEAAWVADHPNLLTPDRIHYTPAGYRARAAMVAAAVLAVRPRPKVSLEAVANAALAASPGDGVEVVQEALAGVVGLDYSSGPGVFGPHTRDAYAQWQLACGFTGHGADGIPGVTSLTRLGVIAGFTVLP